MVGADAGDGDVAGRAWATNDEQTASDAVATEASRAAVRFMKSGVREVGQESSEGHDACVHGLA